MARARIILEAFHLGAELKPHPLGALWALKVAAAPFIGQPNCMPKTSAARRKFLVEKVEKALLVTLTPAPN
jgi:hypothetical protein